MGISRDNMADKLKLSKRSSEYLNFLSVRLNLKRNLICRIAICVSLNSNEPVSESIENDTDGYEFNKSTVIGPDEVLFKALSSFVQKKPSDSNFFNIVIRNHIERGLEKLFENYQTINSPVDFMISLISSSTIVE